MPIINTAHMVTVTLYSVFAATVSLTNAFIARPFVTSSIGGGRKVARIRRYYTLYHNRRWFEYNEKTWLRFASSSVSEETISVNSSEDTQTDTSASSITNTNVIQEVEELRRKARVLMEEANVSENNLRQVSMSNKMRKNSELDEIINKLLFLQQDATPSSTPSVYDESQIVTRLRKLHLSESRLVQVLERIYEREMDVSRSIIGDKSDSTLAKENEQRDIDARIGLIDKLIAAQSMLEQDANATSSLIVTKKIASVLSSRYRELKRANDEIFQRKVNAGPQQQEEFIFMRPSNTENNNNSSKYELPANATLTINFGGTEISGSRNNMTRLLAEIVKLPLWFPSVFLPYVVRNPTSLDIEDLKKIRSEILIESRFKCTSWDSIRFAAIYRGNFISLRKQQSLVSTFQGSPTRGRTDFNNQSIIEDEEKLSRVVFEKVLERMDEAGLSEKIQLFLLNDPEWRPGNPSQPEPSPVILALPKAVNPKPEKEGQGLWKPALSALAILSTLFTTFAYAVSAYALNPTVFDAIVNSNDLSSLSLCVPIFLGVLGLSLVHEIAHFVTAKRLNMDIGFPTPLPSLQIGTFGGITPLRSFPETRSSLLDFALSGPLVCFSVSLLCLIAGVLITIHSSADVLPTLATIPAAVFKSSLLVGSIVSLLAPKVMMLPLSQPIPIHPLFMIGLTGVVASALNLLPIGRLDGGRASTAVFGRRSSSFISIVTLAYLAISAVTGSSTTSVFWGFLVSIFQRLPEIPIRDEVSEVDNARFTLYVVSILITFLVLAPFPGALTAI